MSKQRGFTVLELIIAVVLIIAAGTIFYIQKRDLEVAKRDSDRKTAINTLFYNLEDVYYPANQSYPEKLTTDNLKGIGPSTLQDPNGKAVGEEGSNFRYEPKDCKDSECKSYILTAKMEHEGDFVQKSRNQ